MFELANAHLPVYPGMDFLGARYEFTNRSEVT
jgi:hypothetical protein